MTIISLPKTSLTYPQLTPVITPRIIDMAKAIYRDGLLNPIIVRKKTADASKFQIVDGKTRVGAIKLLSKARKLPRSLKVLPCLDIEAEPAQVKNRPLLKTDAEFVDAIDAASRGGAATDALAKRYDCAPDAIVQALSLQNLHPQIMDYFRSGHLSLEQAAAFATLPNPQAQWKLLQDLGPFAHAADVIAAILDGETVIELPDGDVMILPSRPAQFHPVSLAA